MSWKVGFFEEIRAWSHSVGLFSALLFNKYFQDMEELQRRDY